AQARSVVRSALRQPVAPGGPVAGTPMQMHYGDDVDALDLYAIENPVRKLRNEKTSEPAPKTLSSSRGVKKALVRTLNRRNELETKPLGLAFVEPGRGNEFIVRIRVKLDAAHRSAPRAFLSTCPPGVPR